MRSVLSTRRLTAPQKELLLNAGLSFVDYDAIKITALDFQLPKEIRNAIFSSSNAVDIVFKNNPERASITRVFAVGEKTSQKLKDLGQNVVKTVNYSSELVDFLNFSYKNEQFHFFCGMSRRDEIPDGLNSSKNELFEVKTYKTELKPVKIDRKFDGIMFFSPSGVSSFTALNTIGNSAVICIGDTTASEAKKHTQNIYIANSTTVESVIAKTVKILQSK